MSARILLYARSAHGTFCRYTIGLVGLAARTHQWLRQMKIECVIYSHRQSRGERRANRAIVFGCARVVCTGNCNEKLRGCRRGIVAIIWPIASDTRASCNAMQFFAFLFSSNHSQIIRMQARTICTYSIRVLRIFIYCVSIPCFVFLVFFFSSFVGVWLRAHVRRHTIQDRQKSFCRVSKSTTISVRTPAQ